MVCKKCGREIPENSNFCPFCTEPVKAPEVPYAQPVSASKKKKNGCLIALIAVLSVLAFFALVIALLPKEYKPSVNGNIVDTTAPKSSVSEKATKHYTEKQTKPSTTKAPTTAKPGPKTIKISASKLMEAYDENEVKADNLYKGKLLEVTGIVSTIGKDVFDHTYVSIGSGDEYSLMDVQCYITKENMGRAAELSPGDTITIIGTCTGGTLGATMKSCSIK